MSSVKTLALLSVLAILSLSGCGTATVPMNYAPSSVMTVKGSVAVAPFTYLPASTGEVKPNQIRNTAIGNIYFEQNIDTIIRDSVFKEFRFVGIKVEDQDRKISGEIQEFLIDDLGYSIDWILRIKYVVTDSTGVTYEATKEIKRNTNKFANVFGALNETIKLNVEDLLNDPKFIQSIQ